MKASNYVNTEAEHLIVYGDPGTGKSTLVINLLAAGYKVKYFSIDAGIPKGTLINGVFKPLTQDQLERLEIFILRDTSKFPVGIQTSRKVMTGKELNLCDLHGQISCSVCRNAGADFSRVCLAEMALDEIAVFDHLTNLTNSALNSCWDGEAFANAGQNKAEADAANSTYTTWRQQGFLLTDFLSLIQVAPWNVIVLAQEYMAVFEDKSKSICPHAGTKEFSSTTGSYFGHVIYCSVMNGSHRFGSSSTYKSGVMTKSRAYIKIEDMKEPSLAPFFVPAEIGKDIKPKVVQPVKVSTVEAADGHDVSVSTGGKTLADLRAQLKLKSGDK